MSDREVIKKILSGKKEEYEALVLKYEVPVYNFALLMRGNSDDAADLCCEIFVKAFNNLKRYNKKDEFLPWLCTVAVDCGVTKAKNEKKLPMPENLPKGNVSRNALIMSMQRLPERYRAYAALRYACGLGADETGEILGIEDEEKRQFAFSCRSALCARLSKRSAVPAQEVKMQVGCLRYSEIMSAYFDGEANESEEYELMEHVAKCAWCRSLYLAYDGIAAAAQQQESVPENVVQQVMVLVYEAGKRQLGKIIITVLVCVAAAVAIWYISLLRTQQTQPQPVPTIVPTTQITPNVTEPVSEPDADEGKIIVNGRAVARTAYAVSSDGEESVITDADELDRLSECLEKREAASEEDLSGEDPAYTLRFAGEDYELYISGDDLIAVTENECYTAEGTSDELKEILGT